MAGVGATLATLIVVSALAAPPSPSAAVSTTRYVPLSSGVNWSVDPAPEAYAAAPPFLYTAQLSVRVSCTPGSAADPATVSVFPSSSAPETDPIAGAGAT